MSHADARLTEYAPLLAASLVEQGHKPGEVAKQPGASRQTVYMWVRQLREEGAQGLGTVPPHGLMALHRCDCPRGDLEGLLQPPERERSSSVRPPA